MKIGDKVIYKIEAGEKTGIIHGIRKIDTNQGARVIGYLIDTGNDERVDEYITAGKADNIFVRQPQQVYVDIKGVKPAK